MEADGLRWSLLVIGSLVIVGLAVHGIWLSRLNSEKKDTTSMEKNDQDYQPSGWQSDVEGFDEAINDAIDGIIDDVDIKFDFGMDDMAPALAEAKSPEHDSDYLASVRLQPSEYKTDTETQPTLTTEIQAEPVISPSKIYASVVTQPKPEYAAQFTSSAADTLAISEPLNATSKHYISSNDVDKIPDPPLFLLKKTIPEPALSIDKATAAAPEPTNFSLLAGAEQKEDQQIPHATLAQKLNMSTQVRNSVKIKKAGSVRKRREPKVAEDQMRIDFDEQPSTQTAQAQEVLVLNVKTENDKPISGAALLPMLLTLGFKFGEQDIFHRHVNANGKGPVLFSLANMFKPGNFDIDNLENFNTGGISLFMILPIKGEPHQVFNMMHNAARKIADEFSAQIYDGKRILLTNQSLQQYVEKIREFERQRLLRG